MPRTMEYHSSLCPLHSPNRLPQGLDDGYCRSSNSCSAAMLYDQPNKEVRQRQMKRQEYLRKLQRIEQRKHFALFLRILCHQIKKSGDVELLYTVQETIKICNKRQALHDPVFISQMDSMAAAIRPQVGEVNWSRALRYLRYYDSKLAKKARESIRGKHDHPILID